MPFYDRITSTIQSEFKQKQTVDIDFKEIARKRLQDFRATKESVTVIERPTNLAAARSKGYKAKQGVVMVRVRIRKGSGGHARPSRGRRPKRMGVNKLTRRLNTQSMAEQRASRKHKNMEVLNSYWIGEDGKHKYYEVILLDPQHPSIQSDKAYNWVCAPEQRGRVFRGKTHAGKVGRGIGRGKRGEGFEKNYPSLRANQRKAK